MYFNKYFQRKDIKKIQVKEPEKLVALRLVDEYKKVFDYLDYSPVDGIITFNSIDLISASELCVAYKDYGNYFK